MKQTLRLTLFLCLFAPVVAQAQQTVKEASETNRNWLLALTEPQSFDIEVPAQNEVDKAATSDASAHKATKVEEAYNMNLSVPAFAKTSDPEALTQSELIQIATAHRLNGNAKEAAFWYGLVVKRSQDPRNIYFYNQAMAKVKALENSQSLSSAYK